MFAGGRDPPASAGRADGDGQRSDMTPEYRRATEPGGRVKAKQARELDGHSAANQPAPAPPCRGRRYTTKTSLPG